MTQELQSRPNGVFNLLQIPIRLPSNGFRVTFKMYLLPVSGSPDLANIAKHPGPQLPQLDATDIRQLQDVAPPNRSDHLRGVLDEAGEMGL